MTVLKNIFTRLPEWWTLLPDQSVIISGGNTNGDVLTSERVPLTVNGPVPTLPANPASP